MSEFKRRRGEPASAWCARLGGLDMEALSAHQVEELTLRRVLAGRAARRETRDRLRQSAACGLVTNGSESADVRRCKEIIQALSDEDRRQLMRWLEESFPE